jgi:hypothetical protein
MAIALTPDTKDSWTKMALNVCNQGTLNKNKCKIIAFNGNP